VLRDRARSPDWIWRSLTAVFGLLGPNGARNTTLIGSVCNIVRPTTGTLTIFGHDFRSLC
jgi:ABC-type multidrug transport system ATPase subunit